MSQITLKETRDKVSGYVNSCIFESEESGYKVLDIETDEGDLVTIVGTMPDVEVGERIEASGRIRQHSIYGEQLEVTDYVRSLPSDAQSMERYLSSGIIKGIGEALAERIVEKFGEKTFQILDAEPERLAEVKGISPRKAAEIGEQFAEKAISREAMIYLQELGLTPKTAMKIFQVFGPKTIPTVRTNPYLLAESDEQILGYAYAHEFGERGAFRWTVETSIYVRRDCRGAGVGARLYRALFELLRAQGIRTACAIITCPNDPSFAFHHAMGVRDSGILPNFGYKLGAWRGIAYLYLPLLPCQEAPEMPCPVHMLDPECRARALENLGGNS